MNRLIALAAAIALAGCTAYTQSANVAPTDTVHNAAVACQSETLNLVSLLVPVAQMVDGSRDAMRDCMARKGWVRK